MDNNQFTTTFIPKKPMVAAATEDAPVSRPVGLLSSISLILFIITIIIAGGVYAWQGYETSNEALLASSVTKVESAFEPQLITQLQTLDKQLKNANLIVENHTVVSPIFDLLESSTLKQVQFNKFDLETDATGATEVKMSGVSDGYRSIAQQSDVLGSSTFLKDAIFSNFFLNPQGKVSFDVSFGVSPSFLNFSTAPLSGAPSAQSATVAPTVSTGVIPAGTTTAPITVTTN